LYAEEDKPTTNYTTQKFSPWTGKIKLAASNLKLCPSSNPPETANEEEPLYQTIIDI
jgi:hypothetical protein